MPRQVRPSLLGMVFGVIFILIAFASWFNASAQSSAWYGPDLTRWVYMAYLLAAAVLLAGIGVVVVLRSQFLDRRILEINEQLDAAGAASVTAAAAVTYGDEVPPPLPEEPVEKDHVDRDIDDLLESLSEMETETADAAETEVEAPPEAEPRSSFVPAPRSNDLLEKRTRLRRMRGSVMRYLAGPAAASIVILGVAGAMLPAADGMLQAYHQLNTGLILGFGYAWMGLGAYTIASIAALLRQK